MEKLYYKDFYLKEFTANVETIDKIEDKFHVLLDKTAFFPGGGGQFKDCGYIDDKKVIDVYEKENKVYHVLCENLTKNKNLKCKLDWQKRLDGMEQHFAQHVLSGCFFKFLNKNTVSFHMGKLTSTVDIEGILSEDDLIHIEKKANEMISKNLKSKILTPSKEELKNLSLRRDLPNTDEEIRILKIEDLDINACCGIHLSSTMELKMIKIIKAQKNKNNTRVEYVAGTRAINYVLNRDLYLSEICKKLKSSDKECLNMIDTISNNLEALKLKNKKLEEQILDNEEKVLQKDSEKIFDLNFINKVYKDKDTEFLKNLSKKLINKENFIVFLQNEEFLILCCSKNLSLDLNFVLNNLLEKFDVRGGGFNNFYQASFKNKDSNKVKIYLDNLVKNLIKKG